MDRPIIFSAPMVRAQLDGRKTMTRRILKPQPTRDIAGCSWRFASGYKPTKADAPWMEAVRPTSYGATEIVTISRVPCRVGDRLWVRETWKPHSSFAGMKPRDMPPSTVFYFADNGYAPSNTPWVPCIHMPRWASRLTLEVTSVKVERLQDISEDDALEEGIRQQNIGGWFSVSGISGAGTSARAAFALLWNSINGPDAWAANPWVVAISFDVQRGNIDAVRSLQGGQ